MYYRQAIHNILPILLPFVLLKREKLFDKSFREILLPGFFLYLASAFQQAGLEYTTAGNAGFITGLYVVFVPFILLLVFKEKAKLQIWMAVVLATGGLYLLSVSDSFKVNPGDLLVLVSAVFWAAHVISIDFKVARIPVLKLAVGQFFVCGLLNIFSTLILESHQWNEITSAAPAILYTAVFSIALGFTLQVLGQKFSRPSETAIILSLESVFAVLFGYLILNEILAFRQIIGVFFMFSAMLAAQINFSKNGNN